MPISPLNRRPNPGVEAIDRSITGLNQRRKEARLKLGSKPWQRQAINIEDLDEVIFQERIDGDDYYADIEVTQGGYTVSIYDKSNGVMVNQQKAGNSSIDDSQVTANPADMLPVETLLESADKRARELLADEGEDAAILIDEED